MSEFLYMVTSYPKDSMWVFSNHVSNRTHWHVYAIYSSMEEAVACVSEIYKDQILGVKFDTEYAIIKKRISTQTPLHEQRVVE